MENQGTFSVMCMSLELDNCTYLCIYMCRNMNSMCDLCEVVSGDGKVRFVIIVIGFNVSRNV